MKNDTQSSNQNLSEQSKYNDSEAPDVDFPQEIIPDEVPRKDGPGGESGNKQKKR